MKQKITCLLALLLCTVLLAPTGFADNRVPAMEIDVALERDGSARITQVWWTDTQEGTEFYLGCRDNGYLHITDLSVSDQNGPYTLMESWDVEASFAEKANRCGILETEEGVELCWGISTYGENRYRVEYVLHDLVGAYSDADGFNHRFVDEMSFFPTQVSLTIRTQDGTPLTDELCDVWGFGFDGQAVLENGVIRLWSDTPLEQGQHLTAMVALEKGVLSPRRTLEDSFETVKERAFTGSDYEEDLSMGEVLVLLAVILALGVALVLAALLSVRLRRARLNKRMQSVPYFRDAPNGGNLNISYQLGLCSELCQEDALLGAYLLRLISQGCLEGSQPGDDGSVCLHLCHGPQGGEGYEDALYTILEAAAGPDGVLQPRELEQFCQQNSTPLMRFMDSCQRDGLQGLLQGGCMKGALLEDLNSLTQKGQQELDELLGLKRFLLDFSLIGERGVEEIIIWQELMVYALLLGIADKLLPQLRQLYPEALPQLEQYQQYCQYTGYYNHLMYHAYSQQRQRLEEARSAGSGGRVSFGGGGGFSGGGGGGTR